jgi:hypothetical protein
MTAASRPPDQLEAHAEPPAKPHKRPQRCALCGAFYPLFKENENKVTCKHCGIEWFRS